MNSVVIVTAVYLFVYIGVEPVMAKSLGATMTMIAAYLSDFLVVASMAVLFLYFSKYGKSDKFLESVENFRPANDRKFAFARNNRIERI